MHATLDDWIAREAIRFTTDSPDRFNAAVDQVIASLESSPESPLELLGLGEPLHPLLGGEEFLDFRNRLFHRLVEKHGFTAIAVESSFPRARLVNDYVSAAGASGPASYAAIQEIGFSHDFGRLDANRELIEWMCRYNAEPSNRNKLQFYGFDSPTEMTGTDSPRQLLHFALDYFATIDPASSQQRRERIDALLGPDSDWENPAAIFDPTKSVGQSPAATSLRIETEELISEMSIRRPELITASDSSRYLEAAQHASLARQLLNYHACLARASSNRLAEGLGIRDAMMADNLAYMVNRERGRGKLLAFAHNSHLQRGQARWQLGDNALAWWPAGAHLHEMLGPRYAVIGAGVGVSEPNGITAPERDTLEARLIAAPSPAVLIPTHQGQGLPSLEIAALRTRSASTKNSTYFAFTPQSITDFDWLTLLNKS